MVLMRVGVDYDNDEVGWSAMARGSWRPNMTCIALLEAAKTHWFDMSLKGVDLSKCSMSVLTTVCGSKAPAMDDTPCAADLTTARDLPAGMPIGSLSDVTMENGTVWLQVYLPPPGA